MITYPQPNYVFQRDSSGNASFQVKWRGDATGVTILDGSTVVEASSTGLCTDVPPGWYNLILQDNQTILDSIKIGVGEKVVLAGQSNQVSAANPAGYTAYANSSGKCIIGITSDDGLHISYHDAALETLPVGMRWIHCSNYMNRSFPTAFIITAIGSSTIQRWNGLTYRSRLMRALMREQPRVIWWGQGESNPEAHPNGNIAFQMDALIKHCREFSGATWLVDLNCDPGAGAVPSYYAIFHAQKAVVLGFGGPYPNVTLGINTTTDTSISGIPQCRIVGEVHFAGSRLKDVGDASGARMLACLGF